MEIRAMREEDYDEVYALWTEIEGFGIRSVDDSRDGIVRFLRRNPTTSVVAVLCGEIVGSILCGHDGRRGSFYHVCVRKDCRRLGIARSMVAYSVRALKKEGISSVTLIAFDKNRVGNTFWKTMGWTVRDDVHYYDFVLNEENVIRFNSDKEND